MAIKTVHPKHKKPTLTISCVEGIDQSMCPVSCRDRFQINIDGVPTIELIFDYVLMDKNGELQQDANHGDCKAEVKMLSPLNTLPGPVSNGFELIGRVMDRLNELLIESEGEFYADLFWDEDGNKKEYPITL
jgi:hypothetical protein